MAPFDPRIFLIVFEICHERHWPFIKTKGRAAGQRVFGEAAGLIEESAKEAFVIVFFRASTFSS